MKPMHPRLATMATDAALGAGIAGFLANLAGVRSGFVTVLVLIFIAVAPTSAIAGLLRGFDRFARIILASVTAIAVLTLIAMIMLAIGVWSPRAGLVAIALVSGACLAAQHARPIMSKIAERAEPLRQAMIDYCVKFGGEQTAAWVRTRTAVEPEADATAAPDPDEAAETADTAEAAETAARADAAADEPAEDPETAQDPEPAEAAGASAADPEADQDSRAAATPDEAAEATAGSDQDSSSQDGDVTVAAEHITEAVNGKSVAPNDPAAEKSGEPDVVAADTAARKPARFRDIA
jgi:hypothetical protein